MIKLCHKYFILPYYSNTEINWCNPDRIEFAAGDTETHLYYEGKLLSEDKAEQLMRENNQSWCRMNIEVRAWAFILATDELFFVFQCIEDFMRAVCLLRINRIVWYNAKFDFAIFDHYFLSNGWKNSNETIQERNQYGKIPTNHFNSLHGAQGQRYKLTIWYDYLNKNYAKKVHKFEMVDLFNVLQGGLDKNLESWDIRDKDGNPIRKLTMDYVNDNIEDCADYLIVDGVGLYYLTVKFSNTMQSITGYSYLDGDYITSGGVAKKVMLKEMYNCEYKDALKEFHKDFPMNAAMDDMFRDGHLYKGGMVVVNPKYKYRIVTNVYKLDENSMYPHKQSTMKLPYGKPTIYKDYIPSNHIKIFHITSMYGTLKHNKVGVWQDLTYKEYTDVIDETNSFFIFEEELNELEKWYDLTYQFDFIYYYKAVENEGMTNFINKFYEIKCNSKGTVKLSSKIILNSSYGKLAEKINRETGKYELTDGGYVHFVSTGVKKDTKGVLSIVLGAYVTALARTDLMQKIRQTCNEDVENNFVYCDTDSIHTFTCNIETDDKILGMLKNEAPDKGTYKYAMYIAPKSYIMLHKSYPEVNNKDTLVIHCKGVNVKEVRKLLQNCKSFTDMCKVFRPNYPVRCLVGINAVGGKALIYKEKYILRDDSYQCDMTAMDGGIFYEM